MSRKVNCPNDGKMLELFKELKSVMYLVNDTRENSNQAASHDNDGHFFSLTVTLSSFPLNPL